ncbi:hypothetical protein HN011_001052 [Eciton burchellii]|nr:hypothetical protein HN011_001052 [Eciton burchellii]
MQQASVGGCDTEETGCAGSPSARSPSSFAIKSEPIAERGDGVRVKVEMPEPTEAGVEVKGEPREDYHRQPSGNDGPYHHYNDKKAAYVPDASGQLPHPGYPRPVGLAGSFGFPTFYAHHHHHPHHHPAGVAMPASFPATHGRPSPEMPPIGKMLSDEQTATSATTTASHLDRHVYGGRMPPPMPGNDGFLQPHEHHHHRFEPADFPHAGMPYAGFRSAPTLRSPYAGHQNNSAYSRSGHYHHHPARQRKWSTAAFRGLHPPMPDRLPQEQYACDESENIAFPVIARSYRAPIRIADRRTEIVSTGTT